MRSSSRDGIKNLTNFRRLIAAQEVPAIDHMPQSPEHPGEDIGLEPQENHIELDHDDEHVLDHDHEHPHMPAPTLAVASTSPPKAMYVAPAIERSGLCVICQDEEVSLYSNALSLLSLADMVSA